MDGGSSYDVSPDGKRFLMPTPADDRRRKPLTLFLNWTASLRN
jgi:hypothetical protein